MNQVSKKEIRTCIFCGRKLDPDEYEICCICSVEGAGMGFYYDENGRAL